MYLQYQLSKDAKEKKNECCRYVIFFLFFSPFKKKKAEVILERENMTAREDV